MKQAIGLVLIMVGLMIAAGSANDCDGRCMEQANDLGTMLMVAGAGVLTALIGLVFVNGGRNA